VGEARKVNVKKRGSWMSLSAAAEIGDEGGKKTGRLTGIGCI